MITPNDWIARRMLAEQKLPEFTPKEGGYWRPLDYAATLDALDAELADKGYKVAEEAIEWRPKGREGLIVGLKLGRIRGILGEPRASIAVKISNTPAHGTPPKVCAGLVAANGGRVSLGPFKIPRPASGEYLSPQYAAVESVALWRRKAADLIESVEAFERIELSTALGDALLNWGAIRDLWIWRQVGYASKIWNHEPRFRPEGFEDRTLLSWLYAFGLGAQRRAPAEQLETMREAYRVAKTVQLRGIDVFLGA